MIRIQSLFVFAGLICTLPSFAQDESSTAMAMLPGWGVQAYASNTPWQQLAMAFHFSPDGSFYEVSDEGFQLRIVATFNAKRAIEKHRIRVDAACGVSIFLDHQFVRDLVNEHTVVELDFTPGMHTLEMRNNCGGENFNWMALVVGRCLWGTDKNIDFVMAGFPPPPE